MLLRANGTRTAAGPNRMFSGVTTIAGGFRGENLQTAGSIHNWCVGEHAVSNVTDRSSVPVGYRHPYAWIPPRKSGGLASKLRILSAGAVGQGNLAGGKNADADLTGAGSVTDAALGLIASAVAALLGSGAVSADIFGKLDAVATLAGAGDLDGSLGALAGLMSEMAGSGTVSDALPYAQGTMSADITVTGATLSTANVADAVWGALCEAGITNQGALRVILATLAGKISGAPTGPIVIRDVNDTTDRVTASVDANGNRTAVTLDAD